MFITRIELHSANYQDYQNLHAFMRSEGFSTTVRADGGKTYHLPPAEYHLTTNCTRAETLEKAKRAAAKTEKLFAALVSECVGVTWYGLSEVKQPARVY